ncbi:MAG: YbaN family protein [Bdellovibrionales bacterium]|nr:YbaN family protein [Bdellovibrionales bacterium]
MSLSIGVIGIFVPLLPTTPFILLASFCFSRSSTRLHTWLREHPIFGHLIHDWERYGVIRPRIKILAITAIAAALAYPIAFSSLAPAMRITLLAIAVSVATYIATRPSRPAQIEQSGKRLNPDAYEG